MTYRSLDACAYAIGNGCGSAASIRLRYNTKPKHMANQVVQFFVVNKFAAVYMNTLQGTKCSEKVVAIFSELMTSISRHVQADCPQRGQQPTR